jgi:hypothetical protein
MPSPWDQFAPAPAAPAADPWAQFKPVAAVNPTSAQMASHTPGALETIASHGANGLALGGSPNLRGLYAAGYGSLDTPEEGMDPLTTVANIAKGAWDTLRGKPKALELKQQAADSEKRALAETAAANPKTAFVSTVLGGLPLGGLAAPAAQATTLLGRLGQAATTGAKIGALSGAVRSDALSDVPGNVALDAGVGLVAGPAVQAGGEGLIAGGKLAGNALRRAAALKETPGAALLRREGVPLTTGQRVGPKSIVAQLESASRDSFGGVGAERKAAEEAWMRVTQAKGLAPGQTAPASPDLQSRASEILKGFDPVYEQFKSVPIDPKVMAALPDAAHMPSRGIDARTAGAVKAEIENALTIVGFDGKSPAAVKPKGAGLLDPFGREVPSAPAQPAAPPKATAGDLMKVRSYLRDEVSAARTAQDFPRLRLLRKAEEIVSEGIEGALPPDKASLLRDTDRQYARFLTSLEAAPAGQTTFTPLQYLKRVEKSAGRRGFKTGEAGDLQDLGEAARATFVEAPPTGYTGTILKSVPFGHKLAGPVSSWLNTPAAQQFLFNPPAPISTAMDPSIAAMLAALQRRPALGMVPAVADTERR